jgi:N-acyl-phosphatidylethanolamine-hydrolysing phospholipase D
VRRAGDPPGAATRGRVTPEPRIARRPRRRARSRWPAARGVALAVALATVLVALGPAGLVPAEGHHGAGGAGVPAHHAAGGFRNPDRGFTPPPVWGRVRHLARRVGRMLAGDPGVASLAVATPDVAGLARNGHVPTVTWVGHSTLLVQLDGVNLLTDPHWGARTGPFGGRVGVRRYTPPGIPFEALPPIHVVLVSHDHYDHLDEPTVIRLARSHDPRFVVPLGIGAWLADRGVTNVVELDWGEAVTVRGVTLVCTPAQHASGRTLADQGRRLWASWAVLGSRRFYFGGDSGYAPHFRAIGAAYGPFDLAALAIGSYTPRAVTRPVHTSPEEALQAWVDLRAARFVGIHWGTFALAEERYDEPPRRLAAEVARRGVDPAAIWVLAPGETRRW